MFELTEEQRKQILQYLWSKPSEIQKIEAHENTLIGAKEGIRVVLKTVPQNKAKIIL